MHAVGNGEAPRLPWQKAGPPFCQLVALLERQDELIRDDVLHTKLVGQSVATIDGWLKPTQRSSEGEDIANIAAEDPPASCSIVHIL
jgi:hypothetical protein